MLKGFAILPQWKVVNRNKAKRTPNDQNILWEFSVETLEGGQKIFIKCNHQISEP